MIKLKTYSERLEYLSLRNESYDHPDRNLYQQFLKSQEWSYIKIEVVKRDLGFDLGIVGLSIKGTYYVHHIEPITDYDIIHRTPKLYDLDNLILVSLETHNIIHYGVMNQVVDIIRVPGDTDLR